MMMLWLYQQAFVNSVIHGLLSFDLSDAIAALVRLVCFKRNC